MPLLADIFSAGNTAKRKIKAFAADPLASIEQFVNQRNAQAGEFNRLGTIAEDALYNRMMGKPVSPDQQAAFNQVNDILTDAYNPMGITVYHGSPRLFSRLDPSKIGTGEGAQAYGAGAGYTATERRVAESYSPRDYDYEDYLQQLYKKAEGKRDYNSMEVLESAMMHKRPAELRSEFGEGAESIIKQIEKVQPKSYLYKGDIADELIPNFLDWDAPISSQSKQIQSVAKKYGLAPDDLGGDLVGAVGKTPEGSKILQDAGIPGIKYLDANSRNAQYGSQNFIPFRPEDFKIEEINDISLADWYAKGFLKESQ